MPVRRVKVKADQADPSQVREVVEAIRAAKLVALPTETVYGFAADPRDAAAIDKVRALKSREPDHALTYHLAGREQVAALAPELPALARRLAERYWPGPLTIVVPGSAQETVGLRVPSHEFTRAVLAEFEHGLFLTSANRSGEPPLRTPDEIAAAFPDIDLLCDSGATALGQSSAVVRQVGTELEILRDGTLSRDELLHAAALTVLFVCTGNTCRSPIAEAIARHKTAAAMGVEPPRILARGLRFASAGTMAGEGAPASEHAITSAREVGLDLREHRSKGLTPDLLSNAERIYTLTGAHLHSLLLSHPELIDRASLLDPQGRDLPDPFGGDIEIYRMSRTFISQAVTARMPQILALLGNAK